MRSADDRRLSGRFAIESNDDIHGELSHVNDGVILELSSSKPFGMLGLFGGGDLHGTAYDLTRMSLLKCAVKSGAYTDQERYPGPGEHLYTGSVFPNLVLLGPEHIRSTDSSVVAASFVLDDASSLFYDFDAFGMVLDPATRIRDVANANRKVTKRKVRTGSSAAILYFAGRTKIFASVTALGRISASHTPRAKFGSSSGVAIDNTIRIGFDFRKGLHLEEAMRRVVAFVRFMEIVAGRPQNINQLSFSKKCSDGSRCDLDCYWSGVATRELSGESERPHPSDVLISPVRDPKHFCKVLRSWMARHDSRATARFRFSEAFAHQRRYPIDRLVGAANLFDLLPDDAVPVGVELSPALQDAKRKTKAIFRELPKSEERESVLGALGRMTKATLRKKITFRAKFITDKIGERLLPSLDTVIGEAVKCRNYFVHGTIPAIDYMKEGGDYVSFFTDALEFIFAASEFVEAGWKIESWIESGHVSHPFSGFIVDYKRACQQLQADLKSAKGEAGTSDEGSGAAT